MRKILPSFKLQKLIFFPEERLSQIKKLISEYNQNNIKLNTKSQCHLFKLQVRLEEGHFNIVYCDCNKEFRD